VLLLVVLLLVLLLALVELLEPSELLLEDDDVLSEGFEVEAAGPFTDEVEERESLMYQPLPLNTMPTGWMTLRRLPPHCSQVVSGASEKLCRFSITSLQAVQV
jgi:hypothetical protein